MNEQSMLGKCFVCGGQVSMAAPACPHCGQPGRRPAASVASGPVPVVEQGRPKSSPAAVVLLAIVSIVVICFVIAGVSNAQNEIDNATDCADIAMSSPQDYDSLCR